MRSYYVARIALFFGSWFLGWGVLVEIWGPLLGSALLLLALPVSFLYMSAREAARFE
jgi:hypothetical protein